MIIISMDNMTAIDGDHGRVGARVGVNYTGVDACWGNPAEYMEVKFVEIHITWS